MFVNLAHTGNISFFSKISLALLVWCSVIECKCLDE